MKNNYVRQIFSEGFKLGGFTPAPGSASGGANSEDFLREQRLYEARSAINNAIIVSNDAGALSDALSNP